MKTVIVNQFRGLGDILFCVPLLRKYLDNGYRVIWPVAPEYANIAKHFSEFTFVPDHIVNLDYNSRSTQQLGCEVLPLRFSDAITKQPYGLVMKAKYDMANLPVGLWRELDWKRDVNAEQKLFDSFGITTPYIVVNRTFRTDRTGSVSINPQTDKRIIYLENKPGFTLLDWLMVLRNADEIHTVGTSINYMIDVPFAQINCPVHLYIRRPDERNFDFYNYLLNRGNYIYHND